MQEMISKLQDRIQKAADAVIGRIQKEEVRHSLEIHLFAEAGTARSEYFRIKR